MFLRLRANSKERIPHRPSALKFGGPLAQTALTSQGYGAVGKLAGFFQARVVSQRQRFLMLEPSLCFQFWVTFGHLPLHSRFIVP